MPTRLKSNGAYWLAVWTDPLGRTKGKSLGPKAKMSKRAALAACRDLDVSHALNPGMMTAGAVPTLAQWIVAYTAQRGDLDPKTRDLHEHTGDKLRAHFGPTVKLDAITRAGAAEWRAALGRTGLAEASVCLHVRNAKVMFRYACDQDIIPLNPFDRLKGTPPEPAHDWATVTTADLDRILDHCPSPAWRAIFALCRLAGLRRGEALRLRVGDIDLARGRLVVHPKNGTIGTKQRRRVVPIVPRLAQVLLDAIDALPEGGECPALVSIRNMTRDTRKIISAAGLNHYGEPFHVLRKNCETDWAQRYPQYVVSAWLGHDISVSARHYLQVPVELYDQVAGVTVPSTSASETAQNTAQEAVEHAENA